METQGYCESGPMKGAQGGAARQGHLKLSRSLGHLLLAVDESKSAGEPKCDACNKPGNDRPVTVEI